MTIPDYLQTQDYTPEEAEKTASRYQFLCEEGMTIEECGHAIIEAHMADVDAGHGVLVQ